MLFWFISFQVSKENSPTVDIHSNEVRKTFILQLPSHFCCSDSFWVLVKFAMCFLALKVELVYSFVLYCKS